MDKAASISQAHSKCFSSFSDLISATVGSVQGFADQAPLNDVADEFDKYKLWAANVGAAHSGDLYKISLDYRLREASFYKTQVRWRRFVVFPDTTPRSWVISVQRSTFIRLHRPVSRIF